MPVSVRGTVPEVPTDVTAAKAYGMLQRACARCHQTGQIEGKGAPAAGIANILALEEIAREASLVIPGLPDASRIYNVALTRELHHDAFNDPGVVEPMPGEVQALRDWIAELPPSASRRCLDRKRIDVAEQQSAIDAVLGAMPPESARQTRFISLAHLYNACASPAEIEVFRRGVGSVLAAMATGDMSHGASQRFVPVDRERLILAVSLTHIGWRREQWDRLVASYPLLKAAGREITAAQRATGSAVPVVLADWLAHTVLSAGQGERPVAANPAAEGPQVWGMAAHEALAQGWRRPADIERVAAELGVSRAALGITLAGVGGDLAVAARQLSSGAVAQRSALDRLFPLLLQGASAVAPMEPEQQRLEIALSADQRVYKSGETARFTVTATRDCHLTVVSVDRAGRATILFPSELEPDNRITGGQPREVPGSGAPYRFRFKDKGNETVVAVCSLTHRAPAGVVHDYDRLRFTVLGDWQLFLREPPEMKEARRDDAATDQPRPQQRQRRRQAEPKAVGAGAPDVQTRTAIVVTIE